MSDILMPEAEARFWEKWEAEFRAAEEQFLFGPWRTYTEVPSKLPYWWLIGFLLLLAACWTPPRKIGIYQSCKDAPEKREISYSVPSGDPSTMYLLYDYVSGTPLCLLQTEKEAKDMVTYLGTRGYVAYRPIPVCKRLDQ